MFVHNPHNTPCKSYNSFTSLATTKLYKEFCKSCLPTICIRLPLQYSALATINKTNQRQWLIEPFVIRCSPYGLHSPT